MIKRTARRLTALLIAAALMLPQILALPIYADPPSILDGGDFGADNSVHWQIDSEGTLTIKPAAEGGTGRIKTVGSGKEAEAASNWPWYNSSRRI